jgi:hypothetical protein
MQSVLGESLQRAVEPNTFKHEGAQAGNKSITSSSWSHTRPPFAELPLNLADQSNISEIESQWRKLLTIDWNDVFGGNVPTIREEFWSKAITIKNAQGDPVLYDLSKFAMKLLTLPISNATVERVFSLVTSVKTKLRNRMGLELLSSIIRIKSVLDAKGHCCAKFELTMSMINYNSSIYKNVTIDAEKKTILNTLAM